MMVISSAGAPQPLVKLQLEDAEILEVGNSFAAQLTLVERPIKLCAGSAFVWSYGQASSGAWQQAATCS